MTTDMPGPGIMANMVDFAIIEVSAVCTDNHEPMARVNEDLPLGVEVGKHGVRRAKRALVQA